MRKLYRIILFNDETQHNFIKGYIGAKNIFIRKRPVVASLTPIIIIIIIICTYIGPKYLQWGSENIP